MAHQRISMAAAPLTVLAGAALCMSLAVADEMVSFATGGFARGLRTISEMHKIDSDGDGNVESAAARANCVSPLPGSDPAITPGWGGH